MSARAVWAVRKPSHQWPFLRMPEKPSRRGVCFVVELNGKGQPQARQVRQVFADDTERRSSFRG
eukprot:10376353-Heterocapsa_arctica.AAC.1